MEATLQPSSLEEFLDCIGLSRYTKTIKGQGYENLGDLFLLSTQDLDSVHIMDQDERRSILSAIDNIDIGTWLMYHGLETYEPHFRRNSIKTVGEMKTITVTDDLMNHQLEVMIPGHRKRLVMAANQFSINLTEHVKSAPVTHGYWGRDDSVPTKKCEFLWVEGAIKSNNPNCDAADLKFMLDTGSEVVTCQKEIIEQLGLEFIQIITSKGIHKAEEKSIYRGTLVLGGKELEVEVMPDEYNSLGCNVFRHFSHIIDDRRHVWFA